MKTAFFPVLAAALLSATAQASIVTTTAQFTSFQVAQYANDNFRDNVGFTVNGSSANFGYAPVAVSGSSVTFDYGPSTSTRVDNVFTFTGATANVSGLGASNKFLLGTITYTNGTFNPLSFLDFTLTTQSSNPAFNNHVFTGIIRLDVNSPPVFPTTQAQYDAEADYFTIEDLNGAVLPIGSVRVYDRPPFCPPSAGANCNTGTVDVYGYLNSLDISGFANPTGGAFLNTSTDHALDPVSGTVPEPATLALSFSGLGLLGLARRRRSSRAA
jgi:hypothetical protein